MTQRMEQQREQGNGQGIQGRPEGKGAAHQGNPGATQGTPGLGQGKRDQPKGGPDTIPRRKKIQRAPPITQGEQDY